MARAVKAEMNRAKVARVARVAKAVREMAAWAAHLAVGCKAETQ